MIEIMAAVGIVLTVWVFGQFLSILGSCLVKIIKNAKENSK